MVGYALGFIRQIESFMGLDWVVEATGDWTRVGSYLGFIRLIESLTRASAAYLTSLQPQQLDSIYTGPRDVAWLQQQVKSTNLTDVSSLICAYRMQVVDSLAQIDLITPETSTPFPSVLSFMHWRLTGLSVLYNNIGVNQLLTYGQCWDVLQWLDRILGPRAHEVHLLHTRQELIDTLLPLTEPRVFAESRLLQEASSSSSSSTAAAAAATTITSYVSSFVIADLITSIIIPYMERPFSTKETRHLVLQQHKSIDAIRESMAVHPDSSIRLIWNLLIESGQLRQLLQTASGERSWLSLDALPLEPYAHPPKQRCTASEWKLILIRQTRAWLSLMPPGAMERMYRGDCDFAVSDESEEGEEEEEEEEEEAKEGDNRRLQVHRLERAHLQFQKELHTTELSISKIRQNACASASAASASASASTSTSASAFASGDVPVPTLVQGIRLGTLSRPWALEGLFHFLMDHQCSSVSSGACLEMLLFLQHISLDGLAGADGVAGEWPCAANRRFFSVVAPSNQAGLLQTVREQRARGKTLVQEEQCDHVLWRVVQEVEDVEDVEDVGIATTTTAAAPPPQPTTTTTTGFHFPSPSSSSEPFTEAQDDSMGNCLMRAVQHESALRFC